MNFVPCVFYMQYIRVAILEDVDVMGGEVWQG